MRITQTRLSIDTAPREIRDITAEVTDWTEHQGVSTGLLSVFIQHTSASLLIQEPTFNMTSTHFYAGLIAKARKG